MTDRNHKHSLREPSANCTEEIDARLADEEQKKASPLYLLKNPEKLYYPMFSI
jgi:hypothetical protein